MNEARQLYNAWCDSMRGYNNGVLVKHWDQLDTRERQAWEDVHKASLEISPALPSQEPNLV